MTIEAKMAVEAAYQFECKKDALRQVQDGSVKVTLTINPDDMPPELYKDAMGQRYMAAIVPINDDEQPISAPDSSGCCRHTDLGQGGGKPKSYAGMAKMMAQDKDFWEHSSCTDEFVAEQYIEARCGVQSCSEIVEGSEAGHIFKRLQADFLRWKDTPPPETYEDEK